MNVSAEIQDSVRYLQSDAAVKSIQADPYWPKWHSPWWHMLLLYEMKETKRIPKKIVEELVNSLNRLPVKIFPIHPGEMPEGVDPYRGTPCHCQLGNVYQVLAKWGVNVDQELPWIRPWFLKYQMADGGLNCDNEAYLVKDECPSSMVGTIAAFEAILKFTPRDWTKEEKAFLDKGAKFLMKRQLMLGSDTKHNASEQKSAEKWMQLCFPRFYFYDVLRGLSALMHWAEKTKQRVPLKDVREVVDRIRLFPKGELRLSRRSYEGTTTILQAPTGEWLRKQPATMFPLLEKVSRVGHTSPYLSKQWAIASQRLGRVVY
ncbi:MAG: hypothetical protein AB7N80_01300 [Bdellovibrionales bacterium]